MGLFNAQRASMLAVLLLAMCAGVRADIVEEGVHLIPLLCLSCASASTECSGTFQCSSAVCIRHPIAVSPLECSARLAHLNHSSDRPSIAQF